MKFFNNSSSESEKRISSTKLRHNNRQAGLRGPPLSLVLGDPRSLRRKGPLWWLSFCPWQRFVPNNVRWIFTPDLILACGSDFCQMLGGFSHLGHRLISSAHALTRSAHAIRQFGNKINMFHRLPLIAASTIDT